MEKIKFLDLPDSYRLIVISDIHGNLPLFQQLLTLVAFSTTDYLVINGDLIEKGPDSNGVLHKIMTLSQTNPKVFVTEGNCDPLGESLIEEPDELLPYLRTRQASLLNEWLALQGTTIHQIESGQELKTILAEPYAKEITWLKELPTAIVTADFIFVHAGLANQPNWQETERFKALTIPTFLTKEHQAKQTVIVGHYPVSNYTGSTEPPNNNVRIDKNKRIIAIDGGNQLKQDGQLNALIITSNNGALAFSQAAVDDLPTKIIKADFTPQQLSPAGNLFYPHNQVEILTKGPAFSLCLNSETQEKLWLHNAYLKTEDGQTTVTTDTTSYQLAVSQGDSVSIVDDKPENFTLIKKDGLTGWIPSQLLSE